MQLSVIILNYNVRYFLETCVLSVKKAIENLDAEIIVIDNNSTDDSCSMMVNRFPDIRLIQNNENLGFPKANNIAVKYAKGDYICILNPDTIVAEDTFIKILTFGKNLSKQQEIGIIGCKLIDGTGNFLPESKRGVPTPWVACTKIFGLYKISSFFGKYYAQHLTENQSGKVDILVGAFMFMKRHLYLKMGGFDERCFMYSDDIDLSYSVLKSGLANYYFADTTIIHYKGESTIRDKKYMLIFQDAMNFFYNKHFKKSILFDLVMQIGSYLFSFFKKNQQYKRIFVVDVYVFFTKSSPKLNLGKKIIYQNDFSDFKYQKRINYEIIFDINSYTFKEIINFMNENKAKNVTFKNYIPESNFLIGSNHANDISNFMSFETLV
jgi:GT2 family glycosyltransferase